MLNRHSVSKQGQKLLTILTSIALLTGAHSAQAANVLIVNGSSTTSEVGTTSDITTNLQAVCNDHTYTVNDTPPASLAAYDQIWDLRFSNAGALTGPEQAAYLAFLQSGKRMFVMGENSSFTARNNSVQAFVASAGGGTLSFVTPGDTQTVNAPFTAGGLSSITFNAAGGVVTPGAGAFATNNGTGGTAVAWGTGTLSNAPAGILTVVYDVNFMQPSAAPGNQQFLRNLCSYVTTGGETVAPTPVPVGGLGVVALLTAAIGLLGRRSLRVVRDRG